MGFKISCHIIKIFARINCIYETNKIVTPPPKKRKKKRKGVHIVFSDARKNPHRKQEMNNHYWQHCIDPAKILDTIYTLWLRLTCISVSIYTMTYIATERNSFRKPGFSVSVLLILLFLCSSTKYFFFWKQSWKYPVLLVLG